MTAIDEGESGPLRWAAAVVPIPGADVSGDLYTVLCAPGAVVLAAIDGLGHGPEAASASRAAADALASAGAASPVSELLSACHRALAGTRGAVLSIVSIASGTLTWVGVGNVEGILLGTTPPRRERLLLWGGVVGHTLPRLRISSLPVYDGDLIVMATDGLRADFCDHVHAAAPPASVVRTVLARSLIGRDDALVLAARYRGAPG